MLYDRSANRFSENALCNDLHFITSVYLSTVIDRSIDQLIINQIVHFSNCQKKVKSFERLRELLCVVFYKPAFLRPPVGIPQPGSKILKGLCQLGDMRIGVRLRLICI